MAAAPETAAPDGRRPVNVCAAHTRRPLVDVTDYTAQFADAIAAAGLPTPEIIEADEALHRFSTNGKRGDASGWYVFHPDGIPAGAFGCWRADISETWRADIGRKLTDEETTAHHAKVAAMRQAREDEERRGHLATAGRAVTMWEGAKPATEVHPYLNRKGIQPHGTRVNALGSLLVPMRDADGRLWNLERIAPEKPADGGPDKMGLYRGRRTGCYFAIGDLAGAAALCVCEGFSTGASVHEATDLPVAVAFNCGNLAPVAKALRQKFPDMPLVICGDDDHRGPSNPGRTKAEQTAKAVGGLVVLPDFGPERPEGATDFNDLHAAQGLEAVKRQIDGVLEAAGTEPGTATEGTASMPGKDGAHLFPPAADRPAYVVLDDWVEHGGRKYRPGVYHCGASEQKDGTASLTETWFCSPVHVDATTFDGQENNFGRLLRFCNSLGKWREWSMPMDLLRSSGDELRGELLAMGVELDPYQARKILPAYLQHRTPKRRMHCALQTGWAGPSFVLPDVVIGPTAAGVIFQSGERGHDEYTTAGTLDGWREDVAAKAVGNPLLTIGLSGGFAGPLLARANAEGGGLHLVGDSSTGKTTAIEAACSIWGGPNYRRSWRATANGMEGAAALFNDCLLALDEISECDPREVGAIVYALGNGRGKQRASRSGAARGVTRWRCLILSSGERTIGTTMREGGHRPKAGQSVRMMDVPSARTFGAWDTLHGAASAAAFSDALKRAAVTHHGYAGRAFLERLTRDERDFCSFLEEVKGLPIFNAEGGEGQDKRAAARFALIGMAGELATEYGLTGWPEGDALKAAGVGFELWRSLRGHGNDERRQILERVSAFIERHGDGRFSNADTSTEPPVRDRAGWWRDTTEGREYLFNADGMREALSGFDFRRGLDVLQGAGALAAPGSDGKRAHQVRVGGRKTRLYPINADMLTEGEQ